MFGCLAVSSDVKHMLDWFKRNATPALASRGQFVENANHTLLTDHAPSTDEKLERLLGRLGTHRGTADQIVCGFTQPRVLAGGFSLPRVPAAEFTLTTATPGRISLIVRRTA